MTEVPRVPPALEFVEAPHENRVDYLNIYRIPIGVRNRTDCPIVLDELALTFSAPAGIAEELATITHRCRGKVQQPNALEYEQVEVRLPLVLQPWTNVYRISATYRVKRGSEYGAARVALLSGSQYVVLHNAPNFTGTKGAAASVFVSFKDPEDFALADIAKTLLERAGFQAYLARNDERAGADFWREKIEPAIRAAEGTLLIWTPHTVRNSDPVLRELRYSQEVATPVGLFLQTGTELPPEYPADRREYGGPFDRGEALVVFAREIEGCTWRWREGNTFF